jgi:glycosyltransferase involved in cell wall biosynthesis
MLIAVNTRFLLTNKLEGIGRFTYETLSRITRAHPEHQFLFLFDRKHNPEFVFSDNVIPIELFPPARHPFLFYWWFEFSVSTALKKYKPDVFLSTDGYLSLRTETPSVAVFHDLSFIHYPEGIDFLGRKFYHYFFPRYAHKAARIVAVSNYTKQDIIKQYHINKDLIDFVYNAPAEGFKPIPDAEKITVRSTYSEGAEYFMYVGALHPRKNVETLLKAFDAFKKSLGSAHKLVIVGRKAWRTKSIEHTFNNMQFKDDVIFTGRVSDQELYKITAAAFCMVYIPHFEGFGLPIVEAMACHVPVITSNVSSMPEVAGDAALLVNPDSVEETQQAMTFIVSNLQLRSQLIEKATLRKTVFNWDVSADNLWKCLLKAIQK